MERISARDALSRYEDILQNNGILDKYNLTFEGHQLKTNIEIKTKIKKTFEKIKIPDVKISDFILEMDPKSKCSIGTTFDKKRKRCVRSSQKKSKKSPNKTKKAHSSLH